MYGTSVSGRSAPSANDSRYRFEISSLRSSASRIISPDGAW
jgi:hypothetical protein